MRQGKVVAGLAKLTANGLTELHAGTTAESTKLRVQSGLLRHRDHVTPALSTPSTTDPR